MRAIYAKKRMPNNVHAIMQVAAVLILYLLVVEVVRKQLTFYQEKLVMFII